MTEIIWEDPPETAVYEGQRTGHYRDFVNALRENPQRWARLPGVRKNESSAKNTCQNLRSGKMLNFLPKGTFEAALDGPVVYVRYIGDTQPVDQEEDDVPSQRLPDKVRAWANANGFDLPERGRLPAEAHIAYQKAHAAFPNLG